MSIRETKVYLKTIVSDVILMTVVFITLFFFVDNHLPNK